MIRKVVILCVLAACAGEKPAPKPQAKAAPAAVQTSANDAQEPVKGTWPGQLKIDAHAGTATLNYVGPESGDFVPMHFAIDSEVGAKILAVCADEDLCEVEGTVQFLNEPPPENASAVGKIIAVDRVTKR